MIKQYIVDAFTNKIFGGNPAAVCVLEKWLEDDLLQKITCENNLSETAFVVAKGDGYHLRWFTPGGEIDLCGHATLATAYVISRFVNPNNHVMKFETLSGQLVVEKKGELFEMDFPAYALTEVPVTAAMTAALGVQPVAAYMGRDLLCVLDSEQAVRTLMPDSEKIALLDGLLVHVTAKGTDVTCVSRSFGPKLKIVEDPVCGSGHCHIMPYWSEQLGCNELVAYQASARGGTLYGNVQGERVALSGHAVLFAESVLYVG